jgi:hypothetical protein
MNFSCDLYVYASAEGYTIHVANNKVIGEVPKVDWNLILEDPVGFMGQVKKQSEYLDTAEHIPLGLPFDGQTLVADNLVQLEQFLFMLKETGYRFPEWVLETVREEIKEENSE